MSRPDLAGLLSALRVHEIGTQTPFEVWMAIPQSAPAQRVDQPSLRIVRMSGPALAEGIETRPIDGVMCRSSASRRQWPTASSPATRSGGAAGRLITRPAIDGRARSPREYRSRTCHLQGLDGRDRQQLERHLREQMAMRDPAARGALACRARSQRYMPPMADRSRFTEDDCSPPASSPRQRGRTCRDR